MSINSKDITNELRLNEKLLDSFTNVVIKYSNCKRLNNISLPTYSKNDYLYKYTSISVSSSKSNINNIELPLLLKKIIVITSKHPVRIGNDIEYSKLLKIQTMLLNKKEKTDMDVKILDEIIQKIDLLNPENEFENDEQLHKCAIKLLIFISISNRDINYFFDKFKKKCEDNNFKSLDM